MNTELIAALTSGRAALASVIELTEHGDVGVVVPGDPAVRLRCDVLRTADRAALTLALGDRVLVLLPAGEAHERRGCVLGVVGPYTSPCPEPAPAALVIEASERVEIRCGDSALTLDAEGRVLLKGKDVVTRAKRSQRIRGGTVHIN